MKVIPHRGLWTGDEDKNSLSAIVDGLELFDGVEIDLRDSQTGIIIEHDAFLSGIDFESLLGQLPPELRNKFFALNIKSDGLAKRLGEILNRHSIRNYMCFDLSFPESLKYQDLGLKVFSRVSDLEKNSPHFSNGVVVDCFHKELPVSQIHALTCPAMVISPELHGRDPFAFWNNLRQHKLNEDVMICTDMPFEFTNFWSSN